MRLDFHKPGPVYSFSFEKLPNYLITAVCCVSLFVRKRCYCCSTSKLGVINLNCLQKHRSFVLVFVEEVVKRLELVTFRQVTELGQELAIICSNSYLKIFK